MTMYDKLGSLLSEALEKGELPKSEKESHSESIEETFSDFQFAKKEAKQSQKSKKESKEQPQYQIIKNFIPKEVKSALAFILIPENATFDEAKKIYREKLMYYHPDRHAATPVLQKVAKEKTARLLKEWEKIEAWYEKN